MPSLPSEVKYGEDTPIENAPVLSEEEKHILKKRMAALDLILATKQIGKYKLELMLGSGYRSGQAYPGGLSVYLSGSKMHGGGDEACFSCPACDALIPPSSQGYGYCVCPACSKTWEGAKVNGQILARLTTQGWAELLFRWFRKLEFNCDIYLKRPKQDVRAAADLEQARQRGGERLRAVRGGREIVIYPMRNILRETANGADTTSRFKAFLKS